MKLAKAFGHLMAHVRVLGAAMALRVLWAKKRGPGHTVTVRHARLAGPATLRTGTSDLAILDEVVLEDGYGFELPQAPAVIVDAGANIGLATLWFKARWPQALIIAVEPDAGNYALLQENVRGITGITTVRAAITPSDGMVGWATEGLRPSGFHVRGLRPGEEGVMGLSIGSLMEAHGLEHIDLLKLDIEGGEKELFEAADLGWMDQVDTIAVELHDRFRPGCGHAFFSAAARQPRSYDVHGYLVIATRM